jgi:Protein of unknown function (DUF3443)
VSRRLLTVGAALLVAAVLGIAACGGGGSSGGNSSGGPAVCNSQAVLATPQSPSGNVAPMIVDGGPIIPDGTGGTMFAGTVNQAYTTVTICAPGTTSCQTIDHVLVDTGSYGLRLMCTPFIATKLPPSQQNGNNVANCQQFVANYTWGAVRTGDVQIGGEVASSMPIQVIADAGVPSTAPSSCSSVGGPQNTVKDLGANGLIGIGVFREDCGDGCATNSPPPPAFYYTCPGGTCTPVNMATNLQVQNVVGHFLTDNNGTLIQMQPLASGTAQTATGSLIFGINTQTNNPLGSAVVFAAQPANVSTTFITAPGDIQTSTTFGDMTEPASYVDSGSNLLFFDDPSLTQCTKPAGFYCPASPTPLMATMLPYNTPTNTASFTFSFTVVDQSASTNMAFNNIAGPNGGPPCNNTSIPCTFAWGMPFFYGRSVFTGLDQTTIGGNAGPFYAASTP